MAKSEKAIHPVVEFIIKSRIDYLLQLCNSSLLREYVIAEAKSIIEDPWPESEERRAAEAMRMAQVTKRSEDGVQALASTICRHFEAVNGKPTSKVRIPISSHSDFFEIASDGLMVGGCSENIRMTRVVMEPAFPILVTLYDSVMGLVEDKNATKKHIEEWLPLRRSGILKGLQIDNLLGRNMVLLNIPDMEKPPFFTVFEWAYDLMKGFSPISTKDQFFDDRIGIPYAQLLLQPACLGLAYIVDHHLPIKRCQRESCNRVFRTTTRQQRYCSLKCKSAAKYEKSLTSKSMPKFRSLAAKLNSKSGGFLSGRRYYLDIEEDDILKLGLSKDSLSQMFSEKNRGKFERYGIVVEKHGTYEYSFHSTSKN